jgi:5-methylcytosine-specific restriction endonuclease McrA
MASVRRIEEPTSVASESTRCASTTPFIESQPNPASCWRAIVLFGRNVASYKFALARSLVELAPVSDDLVRLDDLAVPFAREIARHLKSADRQATSRSSVFLDACRSFNRGQLSSDQLRAETVRRGFNNVIDAFHIVGSSEVPTRFFHDERATAKGIRLTDEFRRLMVDAQADSLAPEAEARWRLVETAWNLDVPKRVLEVRTDLEAKELFVMTEATRRVSIVGVREALNGYQKGACFYCNQPITIGRGESLDADVDHFFPKRLDHSGWFGGVNIDGVWNLVLACTQCNRGAGGKFDLIPHIQYLERLNLRNNWLIDSHHPLRETLIAQTGATEQKRASFLQQCDQLAIDAIPSRWRPSSSCVADSLL